VYSDGKMLPPPFFPRNLNPEAGARALASERGEREDSQAPGLMASSSSSSIN
jgi:hypothetical protein